MQLPETNSFSLARVSVFIYGIIAYVIFWVTFLYAIGFLGNILVPKSIDSPPEILLIKAFLVNVTLLVIFAVQHSVMARQKFKTWWTKLVPEPMERSTYVLFSSLTLLLLFWQWQPMGKVIWNINNLGGRIMLLSLFGLGWVIVLISTCLINHFDLLGMRQVYLYLRDEDYTFLEFKTPGLYKYVRHPLYVGWFFAFWMTPTMTVAHLVFAIITTIYILIAIQLEERDLIKIHGETYENYRSEVPMLIPFLARFNRSKVNL